MTESDQKQQQENTSTNDMMEIIAAKNEQAEQDNESSENSKDAPFFFNLPELPRQMTDNLPPMEITKGDPYILGVDVGVASLGLAMVKTDKTGHPIGIDRGFVRVFNIPLGAEERRLKRGARKNNDRRQSRVNQLMAVFKQEGIGCDPLEITDKIHPTKTKKTRVEGQNRRQPVAYGHLSPVKLRSDGSKGKIDLIELQIALRHMAQHRGSSAIRDEDADAKESGVTKIGIQSLRQKMAANNFATYGQFLYNREKKNLPTRLNLANKGVMDADGKNFAFYPSRHLVLAEFDAIMAEQVKHHPDQLSPAVVQRLREILFFQRETTPPPPGKCPFFPAEDKLHRNTILFQKRRIYEDLNHLRFSDKHNNPIAYDLAMRDKLAAVLMEGTGLKVTQIKKILDLPANIKVNLEKISSKNEIKPYPYTRLESENELANKAWAALDEDQKSTVLDLMNSIHNDYKCQEEIADFIRYPSEVAAEIMAAFSITGYGAAGATASRKMLDVLQSELIPARNAQDKAGLQHQYELSPEPLDLLPYYGEVLHQHTMEPIWVHRDKDQPGLNPPHTNGAEAQFGRIPNPVVHMSLNQIRKAVNDVIRQFGKPLRIHVELARELNKSADDRDEIDRKNKKNQKDNDEIAKKLAEIDVPAKRNHLQRYKLWEQQGRKCLYSGQTISLTELFFGEVDVDHILPRSKTMSDSMSNKVVCLRRENAFKGNRSPYEAYHEETDKWAAILRRIEKFPAGKKWRFEQDALKKFEEQPDQMQERYGNDNSYIARVARLYLGSLYGELTPVVTVSSYITSLLRGKWGLAKVLDPDGKKSRSDHRHHFIDALTVALAGRGTVQVIQREAARCAREGLNDFVDHLERPFKNPALTQKENGKAFFNLVKYVTFNRVSISRKVEHSRAGQLHEDTLIGIVDPQPGKDGSYLCVKRKTLDDYESFTDLAKVKIQSTIPDTEITRKAKAKIERVKTEMADLRPVAELALEAKNASLIAEGKKPKAINDKAIFKQCREMQKDRKGSWKFDIFERNKLVNLRRSLGKNAPTGGYVGGRNNRMEFYVEKNGKINWQIISMLEANDKNFIPNSALPGNHLLWKLYKEDTVQITHPERPDRPIECVVAKFSKNKMMVVALHDARDSKTRQDFGDIGLKPYCQFRLRPVRKNTIGQITWRDIPLPASGKFTKEEMAKYNFISVDRVENMAAAAD